MGANPGSQAKRQAMVLWMFVACGLFGAVVGAGHALMEDMDVTLSRGVLFGGALLAVAAGFIASVVYWRNIDEAAREAHKFAWFWGGSGGLLVMPPLGFLITSDRLVTVMGQRSPGEWVVFGMAAMLGAQIIGYGLVWAGWWLRQR